MNATVYVQRDQPAGVPPLELTGERTLPDVPEENYWFQRHLVVYEWIRRQVGGLRVIDMACGEGYGSDVLARSAASVVGVDANPEAHEHAKARYTRPGLRFERNMIQLFAEPADAVVFLQTIEHVQDPDELLELHFASVEVLGLFHARRLRLHELAIRHARWDDIHARMGITKRFYDRFIPAISVRDFALRESDLDRALDFVAVCRP